MSLPVLAAIALLLTAVVAVVSAPLRAGSTGASEASSAGTREANSTGTREANGSRGPVPESGTKPGRSVAGNGAGPRATAGSEVMDVEEAELEALREAKYREIRDAELDFRTGKLSEADFRELDAALRAEGAAILVQLDRVRGGRPPSVS